MIRKKTTLGALTLAGLLSCAAIPQMRPANAQKTPTRNGYDNDALLVSDNSLEQLVSSAHRLNASIAYVSTNSAERAMARGHGTTFVGDSRGGRQYFITAHHVVDHESSLTNPMTGTLLFPDTSNTHYRITVNGQTYELDLVNTDEEHDIAILRSRRDTGLRRPYRFADRRLEAGDVTYAVGYPFNRGRYLTRGVIGQVQEDDFLQTAPTNPGNSGGPIYVLHNGLPVIAGMAQWYDRRGQGIFGAVQSKELVEELQEALQNDGHF